ncbi:uncharacterized protein LOC114174367 [Vigna unguiculata]|uniref:uncharacterized protein LOC114174367 n=1 Tax=Vigna unguiculata TaxID=3917 RepID=UPI00101651D7|nr:uncharacterized protein LOC114174367 [Vigna unguiculata]
MDKSWIKLPRNTPAYLVGLNSFLDFAFQHGASAGLNSFLDFAFQHGASASTIICPCSKCSFRKWRTRQEVSDHLVCKPFPQGYTFWCRHRETMSGEHVLVNGEGITNIENKNPMQIMINDAFGLFGTCTNEESFTSSFEHRDEVERDVLESQHGGNIMPKDLFDLLKDGDQPLYDGCTKYSNLSFLVKLYHIKVLCQISNKAMDMILKLLHDSFKHVSIPSSNYDAKKLLNKLGLHYTKIHACPNDCMLYWGEDEDKEECKTCKSSRWKKKGHETTSEHNLINEKQHKKLLAKVLRYFPLIPRLKRMFMSSKTSKSMVWHTENNTNDGLMRHSKDSQAWKTFDLKYPDFASDPRNVRLALASDRFNPFRSLSNSYSIWPLVLIPYNTPPWMCLKQTNFILTSIIPRKRMLGNDIDVYMQPLIAELKELWEKGVETYDASKNEVFMM